MSAHDPYYAEPYGGRVSGGGWQRIVEALETLERWQTNYVTPALTDLTAAVAKVSTIFLPAPPAHPDASLPTIDSRTAAPPPQVEAPSRMRGLPEALLLERVDEHLRAAKSGAPAAASSDAAGDGSAGDGVAALQASLTGLCELLERRDEELRLAREECERAQGECERPRAQVGKLQLEKADKMMDVALVASTQAYSMMQAEQEAAAQRQQQQPMIDLLDSSPEARVEDATPSGAAGSAASSSDAAGSGGKPVDPADLLALSLGGLPLPPHLLPQPATGEPPPSTPAPSMSTVELLRLLQQQQQAAASASEASGAPPPAPPPLVSGVEALRQRQQSLRSEMAALDGQIAAAAWGKAQ